jgi:hypothetical protein
LEENIINLDDKKLKIVKDEDDFIEIVEMEDE